VGLIIAHSSVIAPSLASPQTPQLTVAINGQDDAFSAANYAKTFQGSNVTICSSLSFHFLSTDKVDRCAAHMNLTPDRHRCLREARGYSSSAHPV
jgi:hypothetical protein